MQHIYNLADAKLDGPGIVAVGMFDGVHLGHQHLLRCLARTARAQNGVPTVLTFFPHPDVVLGKAGERYYLTTPEQRAAMLGRLGIECVVTQPFDDTLRSIRAAAFVDQLLDHLNLRELWVGADFALGYKREGNVDFLRAQGEQKGFKLEVVTLVSTDNNGRPINSSRVRGALASGLVERAAQWLGRPYCVEGEVVHGDKRGRKIGFPTANMDVWDQQALPRNGVYAGWVHLDGETFLAVANVGHRPTFDGGIVRVEAHLLDFDRDIYSEMLALEFVARLRAERRFESVEALVAQIRQDVIRGRAILSAAPRP
ncbi:MAG: bifunctional riboflavin kinase/FAD synthetase [Anaerolineae bacterium]|nr:bifunctional riboflavin kinase/FAD synthetase [Anaerolineae bacterium]